MRQHGATAAGGAGAAGRDAAGIRVVRYLGCLPPALGLASAHARVHATLDNVSVRQLVSGLLAVMAEDVLGERCAKQVGNCVHL